MNSLLSDLLSFFREVAIFSVGAIALTALMVLIILVVQLTQ